MLREMVNLELVKRVKAAVRAYLALKNERVIETPLPPYNINSIIQSPTIPTYRKSEFQRLHQLIDKAETDVKYSNHEFVRDVVNFRDSLKLGWSGITWYSTVTLFSLGAYRCFGPYTDCYSLLFKLVTLAVDGSGKADKIYCLAALLTGLCKLTGNDTYDYRENYSAESQIQIDQYVTLMFRYLTQHGAVEPTLDPSILIKEEEPISGIGCPFG
jgi:hypothetical protein